MISVHRLWCTLYHHQSRELLDFYKISWWISYQTISDKIRMDDRFSVRKNLTDSFPLVVFTITQEETVAKAQAGLKSTMRRLNRNLAQRGINPVYLVVGFSLLCFFCVYIWSKFHRRHWTSLLQQCIVASCNYWNIAMIFTQTYDKAGKGYFLPFFSQTSPDCLIATTKDEPIWAWMAVSLRITQRRDFNIEECIF